METEDLPKASAINPSARHVILPDYSPVLEAMEQFLDLLPHTYGESLKKGKAYGRLQSYKNIDNEKPLDHIKGLISLIHNELKVDRDKDYEIVNAMISNIKISLEAIDNRCKDLNPDILHILLLTLGYVLQYEKQQIERNIKPQN